MEGQGQLNTEMIEFDRLEAPPALDDALLDQLNTHIKGKHWAMSFQCVTMIRSICKFHPQHTPNLFTHYGPVLLDLFTHGATQLVKNILRLLIEVFRTGEQVEV